MGNRRYGWIACIFAATLLMGACGSQETDTDGSNPVKETQVTQEGVSTAKPQTGDADQTETERGTEEATRTEEEPEPVIQELTISATGDCTLGPTQSQSYEGCFNAYYDSYGYEYFFENVRDIFEADDCTLVNLECVLTNSNDRVDKTFNLKGKPEYTKIMTSSSIEACSLGNNHTRDYGEQSLVDTKEALQEAQIAYAINGEYGIFTTEEGLKIGMISVNLLSQSSEVEAYVRDGIPNLKSQGADLVVVSCHWGIEREYYPNDYQVKTAHKIVDWGADLVVGSHPHVLQGMEYYNGKMICYSMGNFCFGGNKNPKDKNTMIYQQTFQFVDGKLQPEIDARIIPCTLSGHTGYNDFQPTVAEGETKSSILEKMNTYCEPYGALRVAEDGTIRLPQGSTNENGLEEHQE